MKDENGGLLADSHNVLNRWKIYFSELLNVCRVSDVNRMWIHTAEPFKFETAIAYLKKCKLPGSGQILAEMIQAGGETLWSEIHKLRVDVPQGLWSQRFKSPPQKKPLVLSHNRLGTKTNWLAVICKS
jgi:hypothetical protein